MDLIRVGLNVSDVYQAASDQASKYFARDAAKHHPVPVIVVRTEIASAHSGI